MGLFWDLKSGSQSKDIQQKYQHWKIFNTFIQSDGDIQSTGGGKDELRSKSEWLGSMRDETDAERNGLLVK